LAVKRSAFSRSKVTKSLILLGMLSLIYLIEFFPVIKKLLGSTFLFSYIFIPALWLVAAFTAWYFPRSRPIARRKYLNILNLTAFVCALIFIILLAAGGLIDGFGKSPYSFTPLGIVFNAIMFGSALLGTELIRANLINNHAVRRPFFIIIIVSLILTFIDIPFANYLKLQNPLDGVNLAGNSLLPVFSEQLMASYLAYLGGPVTSLIYKGTLEVFRRFCPILPNLGWITKTLIGTFIPFFSLIIVQNIYLYESREVKRIGRKKEGTLGWIITSVLAVIIVWFAVGLFPIYPQIIATGSMEPKIMPGDVILVKKIQEQEVNVGDIINFHLEQVSVTHRIVAIENQKGGKRLFRTKGDNNSSVDSQLVDPQQIKGKVFQVIPKIGWPTLYLRSRGDPDTANVEI